MRFYLFCDRISQRGGYAGKFLVVTFLGVHVPMIGAVLYVLIIGGKSFVDSIGIILALLVATLLGTAATMSAIYALLAPVREAGDAINHYLREKFLPTLPTKAQDEAGILMANVQEGVTRLDAALDVAHSRRLETERQSREKFHLLSKLGHELRTPLNHIIGFAEMLSSESLGPLGEARYKDYASYIGASGSSLLDLLQSVLDLTLAEAGAMTLEPAEVAIHDMARDVASLAHLHAETLGVEIVLSMTPAGVIAYMDPRVLNQMLLHGTHLAVDSAGAGRSVTVSVHQQDSRGVITLFHEGDFWTSKDVPPELKTTLGERRTPVDDVLVSTSVPALRLSLLRSLANAAGGQLSIAGIAPGQGRSIVIEIPLMPPDRHQVPAAEPVH